MTEEGTYETQANVNAFADAHNEFKTFVGKE
jgi:hypothetical protein